MSLLSVTLYPRIVGPQASGLLPSLPSPCRSNEIANYVSELLVFYVGAGDLNPGPPTLAASTFPVELSSQLKSPHC